MSGIDPNGGGALVVPGGGGTSLSDATPAALGTAAAGVSTSASRADHVHEAPAGGTAHTSGTLGARPAVPAAGDTYAVTSGASLGARYVCYVAGSWEVFVMPLSAGHSWERLAPATAGGAARFLDTDSLQAYTSSGQASPGWGVELPGGLGPDRASLTTTSGILTTGVDLSGYAIDSLTIAALIYWDGPIVGTYAAVFTFGNNAEGTRGCLVYFKQNGGNVDLIAQGGVGAGETVLQASANPSAGLHAVVVSAVNVAGTHKWRWSLDGSAAADTNMTANYVTPTSTDSFAVGSSGSALLPIPGKVCDVCVWQSVLSSADMALLTTLPGTPTYRLPESASTGAAQIRAEAARYDPTFPLVLPARGLAQPMTVGASVRKVAYP